MLANQYGFRRELDLKMAVRQVLCIACRAIGAGGKDLLRSRRSNRDGVMLSSARRLQSRTSGVTGPSFHIGIRFICRIVDR
jgi:hypothetical protein